MSSNCHEGAYSTTSDYQGAVAFKQTMHQRIHLRPSPETVVFDNYFEGDSVVKQYLSFAPIPGQDTLAVYFSKSADKKDYFVQMKISGQPDTTPKMKVAYTYGGNGWIQRLLININGSHYVVPFQYVLPGYRQRTTQGGAFYFIDYAYWIALDSVTGTVKFLQQNSNKFRGNSWDKNCAFCHVNGFQVDRRVTGTDTSWLASWAGVAESDSAVTDQNIKIGCESCHGPGSEHVTNPSKNNIVAPGTWPMTREGTDLKLALCNGCHTRAASNLGIHRYLYDDINSKPYVPGQLLDSFVASLFNGMQRWADGVTSYAHHQTGQDFLISEQYKDHVYKNGCWDCHTVHQNKQGLPYQMNKNWYSLQDGEGCMSCHGSTGSQQTPPQANLLETTTYNGRTVNKHSMHTAEISQCVNCHFTRAASIGFIQLQSKPLFEFTDHSFRVIKPNATRIYKDAGPARLGMINTCSESCHRNGRGTRNMDQSTPEAPAYGTVDTKVGTWNEPSDLALADSLWFHYQTMFQYVGATPETGGNAIALAVTSVVPNPFQTTTKITFTIARASRIELDLFDLNGNLLRSLAAGPHTPGTYSVVWDGKGELDVPLTSGTYVIRLRAGGAIASEKVSLVR